MNDDLLYQLRRAPRPEFAAALYRRISRPANPTLPLCGLARLALRRPAALGLAAVALSLALALAVSPAARAQVANLLDLNWTRIPIGGMAFSQGSLPTNTASRLAADDARAVSLAEAQAALPALRVPAWAPEGFTLSDVVLVGRPAWSVQPWKELILEAQGLLRAESPFILTVGLTWREETGEDEITLEVIQPRSADAWDEYVWIVDWRGSLAELAINGRPVALLRAGGWIQLQWLQDDGLLYRLAAPETAVSEDDLARMAETIR